MAIVPEYGEHHLRLERLAACAARQRPTLMPLPHSECGAVVMPLRRPVGGERLVAYITPAVCARILPCHISQVEMAFDVSASLGVEKVLPHSMRLPPLAL